MKGFKRKGKAGSCDLAPRHKRTFLILALDEVFTLRPLILQRMWHQYSTCRSATEPQSWSEPGGQESDPHSC
jgi:hypothetical protein